MAQDSSLTSVRVNSDSVSKGPSGVEAEIGAFPPLVGVGVFPDWSGDAALGVASGVDEVCALNTLMGINKGEGSRNKSGVGLICSITSSNGIRLVLLRCSARFVHANVVSTMKLHSDCDSTHCQAPLDQQDQYSQ